MTENQVLFFIEISGHLQFSNTTPYKRGKGTQEVRICEWYPMDTITYGLAPKNVTVITHKWFLSSK